MFGDRRNLYVGFHGCEKALARELIGRRQQMSPSRNSYDWLGSGVYFWENDPERAFEFAQAVKGCEDPFVVGAILDLNYCLDLTCRQNAKRLSAVWENIVKPSYDEGVIRSNAQGKRGENGELMLRFLDCYVIEALHKYNRDNGYEEYDSVRAAFWEGNELYPTAGFLEKNHIQLCVRNPHCILGLFLPDGFVL